MGDLAGRPLVDVRINGKGPYPFILDTGASVTVVSPDVLADVGLGDGTEPARLDQLQIGDAILHDVKVARLPVLGGRGGASAPRGVLSALAFSGYLTTIDFPRRLVTNRRGALPPPDGKRVFEYPESEILPVVPVRVAGREYRIHVDSGAQGGLTLPTKYQDDLPLDGPRGACRSDGRITLSCVSPVISLPLSSPFRSVPRSSRSAAGKARRSSRVRSVPRA